MVYVPRFASRAATTVFFAATAPLVRSVVKTVANEERIPTKKSIGDVHTMQRYVEMSKGDKTIILYGMKHIAPQSFLDRAVRILQEYPLDAIILEGVQVDENSTGEKIRELQEKTSRREHPYNQIVDLMKKIAPQDPHVQSLGSQREAFTALLLEDKSNVHDIVLSDSHGDDIIQETWAALTAMEKLAEILHVFAQDEQRTAGDIRGVVSSMRDIRILLDTSDDGKNHDPRGVLRHSSPVRERIAIDAAVGSEHDRVIIPWGNAHIAHMQDLLISEGYRVTKDMRTKFV